MVPLFIVDIFYLEMVDSHDDIVSVISCVSLEQIGYSRPVRQNMVDNEGFCHSIKRQPLTSS